MLSLFSQPSRVADKKDCVSQLGSDDDWTLGSSALSVLLFMAGAGVGAEDCDLEGNWQANSNQSCLSIISTWRLRLRSYNNERNMSHVNYIVCPKEASNSFLTIDGSN